jgi:hypothetical protein
MLRKVMVLPTGLRVSLFYRKAVNEGLGISVSPLRGEWHGAQTASDWH